MPDLQGDGFVVSVGEVPATIRVIRDGRTVLASPEGWGAGLRIGRKWHAARVVRSRDSSVVLQAGGNELELSLNGHNLKLEFAGTADAVGIRFAVTDEWFGQGTFFKQVWPLSKGSFAMDPFETADGGRNLQAPAWITSGGVAAAAPGYQKLSCAMNKPRRGEFRIWSDSGSIELWIHVSEDAATATKAFLDLAGAPAARPPSAVLSRPIWTTWAEFKTDIDQTKVLRYAERIVDEGFPRSVMEIDAKWQGEYGDTSFDRSRFPDPAGMIERLHSLGFAVTTWLTWMVDEPSENFEEGERLGHFLKGPSGESEIIPWFMNKTRGGALLDCSSDDAWHWWLAKLKKLCSDTALDGFKFDAGEASFLPPSVRAHSLVPNLLSDRWAAMAAEFDYSEARTGWWGQRTGVLMRQWDKLTAWGRMDGLATIVPQAVTMSMIGYPFVLPDMVGGNEYGNKCKPELLVRWAQASAFMPSAQFSVAPWRWGERVTRLVRATTEWRQSHASLFDRLADRAVSDGTPMILPAFWLAPRDPEALSTGDQFLLGEDLLVAPVTKRGVRARSVYFPPGSWVDRNSGRKIEGPQTIEQYPAPLQELPCFGREGSGLDTGLSEVSNN